MNDNKHTGKLPNALLIGVQKAGTTSLFDWIAQHPEVYTNPRVKDFPFFWYEDIYRKGIGHYASFFEKAADVSVILGGDVNNIFFAFTAERIHAMNPDARLIICLRNPADRAYSAFSHAVERGIETRSFDEAIRQELDGLQYHSIHESAQKDYVMHGCYWSQIQNYLNYFQRTQMHFVLFDDLKKAPAMVSRDVFQYLRINASFTPIYNKRNVTGGARFAVISRMINNPELRASGMYRAMGQFIPDSLRQVLRSTTELLNKKRTVIPPPDEKTIRLLSVYYKVEINSIAKFIGRDLGHWLK